MLPNSISTYLDCHALEKGYLSDALKQEASTACRAESRFEFRARAGAAAVIVIKLARGVPYSDWPLSRNYVSLKRRGVQL